MSREDVTAPSGTIYPVWQTGAGKPLLLLHGFTGSHETWRNLAGHLSAHHIVTTLDLPGHGESTLPTAGPLTFAAVVDDLAWIIAALHGGQSDVLGYSMGGRIALAMAIAHPERVGALVLESASPGIADAQERQERHLADEGLADRILEGGVDTFVAGWERLPMWGSQATLSLFDRVQQRKVRLGQTPEGLAASLRATGTAAQPSYWEQLSDLTTPTLIIAGELDQKFAQIATTMHAAIPDSRLEIVAKAGHAVHLEQPAIYTQLVSQFLNRPVATTT